jgi:hypothetical protein
VNLTLVRDTFTDKGIFGILTGDGFSCVTLEHAYPMPLEHSQAFEPKLQDGSYTCVRGIHRLSNLIDFETFEITGVLGHSDILFHKGNYNADSEGCVLLGEKVISDSITNSLVTFNKFLDFQQGCDTFQLVVQSKT